MVYEGRTTDALESPRMPPSNRGRRCRTANTLNQSKWDVIVGRGQHVRRNYTHTMVLGCNCSETFQFSIYLQIAKFTEGVRVLVSSLGGCARCTARRTAENTRQRVLRLRFSPRRSVWPASWFPCSGGRMPGGSSPAMSFQDFAHGLHRYGIMPYVRDAQAGEAKGDESSDPPDLVRALFRDAKRGHWPGDATVRMNRFALLRRGLFLTTWFHAGSYQNATLRVYY